MCSATAFPVGQQQFFSEFAFRNVFWFCRLHVWYGWIYCSVLFCSWVFVGLVYFFIFLLLVL